VVYLSYYPCLTFIFNFKFFVSNRLLLIFSTVIIMGSSISRIDDEYSAYVRFCKKLGEEPKDYEDVESHTKELIEKYKITYFLWWL
jgi:hypothetical protein